MKVSLAYLTTLLFTSAMLPAASCTVSMNAKTCITEKTLSDIMSDTNYVNFVTTLSEGAPSIIDTLTQGRTSAGGTVDIQPKEIQVWRLKASQNEIGLDDSLAFPLKNAKYMMQLITATEDTVIRPKGINIIVAGDNVIDGHHRWSTILLLNPRAKIGTLSIQGQKSALNALKATQAAILATQETVPTSSKQGENMLTMDEGRIKDYVEKTIQDPVVEALSQYWQISSRSAVIDHLSDQIRKNLAFLKENNVDRSLNITRTYMPQTDDPKQGEMPLWAQWSMYNPNPIGGFRKKTKKQNRKKTKRQSRKRTRKTTMRQSRKRRRR